MRSILLLAALLPLSPQVDRPIDVPAPPTPDYPLQLHVLVTRQGQDAFSGRRSVPPLQRRIRVSETAGTMHGYGTANLIDPGGSAAGQAAGTTTGVEYAFDCAYGLAVNGKGSGFYPARWTKPGSEVQLLTQRAGTGKTDTCTVRVTAEPQPYDTARKSAWHSATLGSTTAWRDPDVAWHGNSADYPVHLRVLDVHFRDSAGGVFGSGSANLLETSPRGAVFTFNCDNPVTANSQPGEFYLAHWVHPDRELEILQARIGSAKIDRCKIRLTMQPAPFPDPS